MSVRDTGHDSSSSTGATTTPYPCCSRIAAARAASCLARDEDRDRAAALAGEVLEVEVGDVDPLGAERLRDPGDHARPVGNVHAQPLELARRPRTRSQQPAPVRRGLADPAREEAGVAGRERRLDLLDAAAGARRARRRAPRGSRGRCRPRCAGSRRRPCVMSRSEPPAAASGSCPSTATAPAWFRSTFASACGRWLVTATSRSCASGSIATGIAPSAETKPCSTL